VLERGTSGPDDPQYGVLLPFPRVESRVRRIADGETLRVGTLALTAHFTPGHTPGGTSWSWSSCDDRQRCLNFVYADSQTPVSADGFFYTKSLTYPSGVADFEHGQRLLALLPCDVLLTPHPSASALWDRVAAAAGGAAGGLVDRDACRRLAATGAAALAKRIATERAAR
jgi:metallo-beta-lactamase class B